jgi:inosine-uridine nucleoside N-ribohydrolase
MFKLQVIMLSWDRKEAEQAVSAAAAVMQQLEQQGGPVSPAFVAMLKLQFTMLQVRQHSSRPMYMRGCTYAVLFNPYAHIYTYYLRGNVVPSYSSCCC